MGVYYCLPKYTFVDSRLFSVSRTTVLSMYIYYTMAPGTDAQKSSQALTWIYALVTQRTSITRCIQRAEPSYGHGEMWRLHGTARLPAESSLPELLTPRCRPAHGCPATRKPTCRTTP